MHTHLRILHNSPSPYRTQNPDFWKDWRNPSSTGLILAPHGIRLNCLWLLEASGFTFCLLTMTNTITSQFYNFGENQLSFSPTW